MFKGLTYISLEYIVYAAIVFSIAAFFFGVTVLFLVCQEGAKRLAAGRRSFSDNTHLPLGRARELVHPHKAEQTSRA